MVKVLTPGVLRCNHLSYDLILQVRDRFQCHFCVLDEGRLFWERQRVVFHNKLYIAFDFKFVYTCISGEEDTRLIELLARKKNPSAFRACVIFIVFGIK